MKVWLRTGPSYYRSTPTSMAMAGSIFIMGSFFTSESGLVDLRESEQSGQNVPFKDKKNWVEEECVPRALLFFLPVCPIFHLLELESQFL